jgi:hypothetical protein
VNDLAREVGGAFGIAVLGSVLNSGYRNHVAPGAAKDSIAAATQIAEHAGAPGAALLERAQDAFVNGLSTSLLVGACVLFGASVVVALLAPQRQKVDVPEGRAAVTEL